MWPWRRNPYEEGPNAKIVLAVMAVIILIAAAFLLAKSMGCRAVWVKWSSSHTDPGSSVALYVHVKNLKKSIVSNIRIVVDPISPFLRTYVSIGEENAVASNQFIIPKMAPGDEAIAKYIVYVDKNAYAGDHSLKVTVYFPDWNRTVLTKLRVE
jgi:hypothetical protein